MRLKPRHRCGALSVIALLAVLCGPAPSRADEETAGASIFTFHGFGTLGVTHASTDQADFVGSSFQPNGAGYSHRWSPGIDSKLGVQLDAHFNDRLSAVVQVTAEHQDDNSYAPALEWINVKYQFTPDFSVRVGRTTSPIFLMSDSGLVSYTYPWVRPPPEVYAELPVDNKDGVDLSYRFRVGASTHVMTVSYGQFTLGLPGGGEAAASHFLDLNETLDFGSTTLRVGYSSLRLRIDAPLFDALFAGFTQFGNALSQIPGLQPTGAQALALVSKYHVHDTPYSLFALGAKYDPGTWLVMAEWVKAKGSASITGATAWYVTGGYQFKKLTPFVTLAQVRADALSEPGIDTTGLPPDLAGAAGALNAGLAALLNNFTWTQKDLSVGIRWDFMRNTALKLQYDHLMLGARSDGHLINAQPGFQPGSNVNLFSANIDFVF